MAATVAFVLLTNVFIESPQAGPVYADGPGAQPCAAEPLSLREEGLEIKGELPEVQDLNDLGAELNRRIQETYRQKVAAAKESKARSITFSYEYYSANDGVCSIVLYSSIATVVSKKEVDSFNYRPDISRVVGVNDILGANGLEIASKVISQRIRADSDLYYTNFPGLQDTGAFYVSDGDITFLFDAFQIAPGSEGVVPFTLRIGGVINAPPLRKGDMNAMPRNGDGYWIKDASYSLKMVSLRAVCDGLRYQTGWNADKTITVGRADDVTVGLKPDENIYMSSRSDAPEKIVSRSLESAPVTIGGVTYVPISFFDQILELVAYHVDENDNILFTTYLDY